MKQHRVLLASIISAALLLATLPAGAMNYGGVGGQPANPQPGNPRTQSIFIYQLKPGQSVSDGVRVLNNTGQPQTVSLDAVDSELASGGSFTCKQAAEPKTGVGSWIQLQSTSVTVPANSNAVVPFTLTVPASANVDVGEHDGCITLQAASQTATPSSSNHGVLLSFRTAIRVAVTIPGKIIKKLTIAGIAVSPQKGGTYQVSPMVRNEGNVSLDTNLTIRLVSLFGPTTASVKEGASPVLPQSSATWNYTVKHPFWGGWYRAQVVVSYNANPADAIGVQANSDTQTQVRSSAVFFAGPSLAAGLIEAVIALAIVLVIVWLVWRTKRNRQVNKHWQVVAVKKGATLQTLAAEYGVKWQHIAKVNKLKPPYHLESEQKLKLPTKKG